MAQHVLDVTAADFQSVIERSLTTPVLFDFWAEWCGPCKTLGPVLERLAGEYGGGFLLGRVDADREVELAQAFRVQSLPFCILVREGRPVDGFTGALPENEVRAFLKGHGVEPAGGGQPSPEQDPDSPEAHMNRARRALAEGDADGVLGELQGIPEEHDLHDSAERMRDSLEFLTWQPGETEAGSPAAREILAGREAFLAGDPTTAMERLLASVEADKGFHDGLARKGMLLCFTLLGEDNEACDGYRRRLATLLY